MTLPSDPFLSESDVFPSETDAVSPGPRPSSPTVIVVPDVSPDWESLFPREEPPPGMFNVEVPVPAEPSPPPTPLPKFTRWEFAQLFTFCGVAAVSLVVLVSAFVKPSAPPVVLPVVGDAQSLPVAAPIERQVLPMGPPSALRPVVTTAERAEPVVARAAASPTPVVFRTVQPSGSPPRLSTAEVTPALAVRPADLAPPPPEPVPVTIVGREPATSIEVPAAASPAPSAVPVPARMSEASAIELVLGRYRRAFAALDVNAVADVWPGVNTRSLGNAFKQLRTQELNFDNCRIDVSGSLANVACGGTTRFVPVVGNQNPRVESRRWMFYLTRTDRWTLVRVESE